ncbi:MAG: 50S ribosomal protein L25/general stress protein Ctc [Alphaproteobacteria bacterium]|nr:50S ribosomal protein L25/general stress protein Ctc [Alphaproteobacteria bacterium]
MSDVSTLSARARDRVGKGSARAARREGLVPAVIYGDKQDPVTVVVARRELDKLLNTGSFFSQLLDIEVDGTKHRVLPRDLQQHPVSDFAWHVDFLRVSASSALKVDIPVEFINDEASPGLKRGGVLNVVRHSVEVTCRADSIPEKFEVDLTGLEIGDSVHISMVSLPDGVKPTIDDRDFTIATIAAPTVVSDEQAEANAAADAQVEAEDEDDKDESESEED